MRKRIVEISAVGPLRTGIAVGVVAASLTLLGGTAGLVVSGFELAGLLDGPAVEETAGETGAETGAETGGERAGETGRAAGDGPEPESSETEDSGNGDAGTGPSPEAQAVAGLTAVTGALGVALLTLAALIGGFLAGALSAIVYNLTAGVAGGIRVELEDR